MQVKEVSRALLVGELKLKVSVTHPCDSWAKAAGFGDWALALSSMRAGHVVAGPISAVQSASKSMFGIQLFMEFIEKEGLHVYVPTDGSILVVGYQSDFPLDLLADHEKQAASKVAPMLTT